jgi:phospholipid/cholesterol/gamma-HCH transport system substrate-binding protein
MKKNIFETVIGFIVLICAGFFLYFALKISNTQKIHGYHITAKFENIEGILPGSDVKIGGIRVGSVIEQKVDTETYQASVKMEINNEIKIPSDSSVKISSGGLMGSKFVKLEVGSDIEYLEDGDEIEFTQSTIDLEDLIGRFVFNKDKDNKEDK